MNIRLLMVSISILMTCSNSYSQQTPWEDYARYIKKSQVSEQVHESLLGDSIDFYTGRVSFSQVDIAIEGNSSLPVNLVRGFSVKDPVVAAQYANVDPPIDDQPFADWVLDIPRISGVFAQKLTGSVLGPQGMVINPGTIYRWSDQRCSGQRVPPWIGEFAPMDYWYGLQAEMPGGGELLTPTSGLPAPTSGGGFRWITSSRTWFSCLPSIKNTSGEGFLAITADGTKYWFDWMAQFHEPTIRKSFVYTISQPSGGFGDVYEQEMIRRRNTLYVSRIEDRYGNWVSYRYSNASDQPIRLDAIESNDGRFIALSYNGNGKVVSASANGRTWSYSYSPDGQSLTRVNLPDGSAWSYDLTNYFKAFSVSEMDPSSCNYPGTIDDGVTIATTNKNLFVRHPSGALGIFEIRPFLRGRSNVPQQCQPSAGDGGPEPGAAYSDYVRFYWTNSLIRKTVSGPGVPEVQWTYRYNGVQSSAEVAGFWDKPAGYAPPGSWAPRPYTYSRLADEGKAITDISTYIIVDPICLSDNCAGSVSTEVSGPGEWTRYTFGNSYRYNERKMLRKETGTGPAAVARVENFTYELGRSNLPYLPIIGATRQYQGDGLAEAALRPLRSESVRQDGVNYAREVLSFDAFARPTSVRKTSSATP
ncbi:RHS repeat domain-containing protein [Xanthomonas sp. NCPPB 1068]|uniref:RHS repeat domain-containing protein n=1 Tax=Xanthomonas sp. NCPPB 1068 TaxID=487525 RepID=UPI0035581B84